MKSCEALFPKPITLSISVTLSLWPQRCYISRHCCLPVSCSGNALSTSATIIFTQKMLSDNLQEFLLQGHIVSLWRRQECPVRWTPVQWRSCAFSMLLLLWLTWPLPSTLCSVLKHLHGRGTCWTCHSAAARGCLYSGLEEKNCTKPTKLLDFVSEICWSLVTGGRHWGSAAAFAGLLCLCNSQTQFFMCWSP